MSSRTRPLISSSCSRAVIPSGEVVARPTDSCSFKPATRIWKNSSRLLLKIARNRTRSKSGRALSSAKASTRALKSSHESSRFANRWEGGTEESEGAAGTASVAMGRILRLGTVELGIVLHVPGRPRPVTRPTSQAVPGIGAAGRGRWARDSSGSGPHGARRPRGRRPIGPVRRGWRHRDDPRSDRARRRAAHRRRGHTAARDPAHRGGGCIHVSPRRRGRHAGRRVDLAHGRGGLRGGRAVDRSRQRPVAPGGHRRAPGVAVDPDPAREIATRRGRRATAPRMDAGVWSGWAQVCCRDSSASAAGS